MVAHSEPRRYLHLSPSAFVPYPCLTSLRYSKWKVDTTDEQHSLTTTSVNRPEGLVPSARSPYQPFALTLLHVKDDELAEEGKSGSSVRMMGPRSSRSSPAIGSMHGRFDLHSGPDCDETSLLPCQCDTSANLFSLATRITKRLYLSKTNCVLGTRNIWSYFMSDLDGGARARCRPQYSK